MEIRIPMADATKFDLLATSMEEENVKVNVSESHGRRDGSLSIRATLTPAKSIEETRLYRAMGEGYTHPRNGGQGHTYPRAVFAACYHGHYAFMDKLFKTIPEAKLKSAMTLRVGEKWMTATNFRDVAHAIGEVNVGSQVEPKSFVNKCECSGLPTDPKAELVECASCGEKVDKESALWGETGTYYDSKPLCETCFYEADVLATVFYNGDERDPKQITDSRNDTDGEFTAKWHSTDAWRGYFDILSDDYTAVSTDAILWGESQGLVEKKDKLNELFQAKGIKYVHVVSRTSNLFSQGWDVMVANAQVKEAQAIVDSLEGS